MFSYFYEPLIRVGTKKKKVDTTAKESVVEKPEYV
jgi:hypothetical protein